MRQLLACRVVCARMARCALSDASFHTPAPPELYHGLEQFNRGEFFECHETLEALWLSERGAGRGLYQGILQVGVGFYHLLRGNRTGTLRLLDRGIVRLERFMPERQGIDVASLVRDARRWRRAIARMSDGAMRKVKMTDLPKITYRRPDQPDESGR